MTGTRAALLAIVAFGALLRFSTLGLQHPWLDEAVTQGLVRLDVADMLRTLSASEATPPLYYLAARAWVVVFGSGDVGLRALSALAGTLTIPVAYAVGATLASSRTGLFAALLTAVSPPLVWYSQEARSYALLVLLSGVSLLFLARALRDGSGRALAGWVIASALAVLTHYFAGFLIAGEAAWLLAAFPRRRLAGLAVASVGGVCLALLPLALHQSEQVHLDFIEGTPLPTRVADAWQLMLAGPTGERVRYAVPVATALVLAALAMLVPDGRFRRREVILPAFLVLAGSAVPLLLALAGADYVLGRNLLPLWLPGAVVVAAGLSAAPRRGLTAAAATMLAAASLWLVAAVPLDRTLQREAATAALLPGALDAEEQHILPRVRYAVAQEGAAVVVGPPPCPEPYTTDSRGAAWLSPGNDEPLSEERAARGRILSVYAICVRPLD